jgi:hypothetical protein
MDQIEVREQWRPVDGFEGFYEVSNLGRVRSLVRRDSIGRKRGGFVLRPALNSRGYLQVTLAKECENHSMAIHRLVAAAFVGTIPVDRQVDHIDGDKLNNCVGNLRYVTPLENIGYGIAIGLHKPRKLAVSDLTEIPRLALEGMSHRVIGRQFNVSHSHIGRILRGKHYKLS